MGKRSSLFWFIASDEEIKGFIALTPGQLVPTHLTNRTPNLPLSNVPEH